MTDRELLELAAKAAGLRICHFESDACAYVANDLTGDHFYWAPKNASGDALGLAVKLRINIIFGGGRHYVGPNSMPMDVCREGGTPESIRWEILATAAEIGKAMP